jgi:dTDP-4-amino-4,6-dideoxygalactose transaminase
VSWRVPLSDLPMPEEDVAAVVECLESGWLTMGPRTQAFERALEEYTGARNVVVVSSGTAALHLACLAAGLGPDDEAIVPSFTFVATPNAIRYAGATPVFCDVCSPLDPQLDPDDVARRIGPRTKAVLAVHFWGYPAPVGRLRELCDEHGLVLIEDAAEAIGGLTETGGMAGTVGELGCLSFFSKKQLCVGEGGAVLTDDDALADRVRSLRSHGMTTVTWDRHRGHAETYDIVEPGFNFRIDEPRAALGHSRLGRLADDIEARREVARGYRARLAGMAGLELPFDDAAVDASSHFAFPVLVADRAARDAFREELQARGIQTTWYPAVHGFTDYRRLAGQLELPHTEAVADRHCALPMAATLGPAELDIVAEAVEQALAAVGRRAA